MKNFQRAIAACSVSVIAALGLIAPASAATTAVSASGPNIERVSSFSNLSVETDTGVAVNSDIVASADAKLTFERVGVTSTPAPPKPAPVTEAAPEAAPEVAAEQAAPAQYVQAAAPVTAAPAAQAYVAPAIATADPVQSSPVSASGRGAAIVAAALAQIGVEQDCTMLVTNSLRAVGINFHSAPAGYMSLGNVVSAGQAQPGDLIYYANAGEGMPHIAVYIGGGKAVHGGWNGHTTAVATVHLGSGPVFIHVR